MQKWNIYIYFHSAKKLIICTWYNIWVSVSVCLFVMSKLFCMNIFNSMCVRSAAVQTNDKRVDQPWVHHPHRMAVEITPVSDEKNNNLLTSGLVHLNAISLLNTRYEKWFCMKASLNSYRIYIQFPTNATTDVHVLDND